MGFHGQFRPLTGDVIAGGPTSLNGAGGTLGPIDVSAFNSIIIDVPGAQQSTGVQLLRVNWTDVNGDTIGGFGSSSDVITSPSNALGLPMLSPVLPVRAPFVTIINRTGNTMPITVYGSSRTIEGLYATGYQDFVTVNTGPIAWTNGVAQDLGSYGTFGQGQQYMGLRVAGTTLTGILQWVGADVAGSMATPLPLMDTTGSHVNGGSQWIYASVILPASLGKIQFLPTASVTASVLLASASLGH